MQLKIRRNALRGAFVLGAITAISAPHAQAQTFDGFAPQVTFSVGAFPQSVTLGDLNGDGALDLAVANDFSNTVSILINQTVVCTATPDLNGDGIVDASDLANLLAQWGSAGSADLNCDGAVNATDLAMLLNTWG